MDRLRMFGLSCLMLKVKLKSSSLVEVLIAMVLSGIVFTLALTVFLQVTTSGILYTNLHYKFQLQAMINEDIATGNLLSLQLIDDQIVISKEVDIHNGNPQLIRIKYTAFNQEGKMLSVQKRLVYVNKE